MLEPCTFNDVIAVLLDPSRESTPEAVPATALAMAPGTPPTPPSGLMCVEPTASADALSLSDLGPDRLLATTIIVGPEGGWTAEEIAAGSTACRLVTLGPRTLRADAMALVALTALFACWREI